MARTLLPGFATLSEFVAGLNGDCGPTATLSALNQVDPARWPLTPAALRALDTDEISHGFAEANGAQNIPSMSSYLDRLGIAHTTYGYDACPLDLVHSTLRSLSGQKPIIVEWANAGALPGDEPGVHFHFSTAGGIDTGPQGDGVGGGYLWCDGDNRADDPGGAPRPPMMYTWANIQAAQPIAMIVIDQAPKASGPMAWHIQPDGSGVDDRGHTCGGGLMAAIGPNAANGLDGETAPGAFGFTVPGVAAWLPLEDDTLALWTGSAAQVVPHGGELMHTFAGALAQAFTHAHDLEAQNTALQDKIAQLESQPTAQPITLAQACAVIGAAFNGKVA